MKQCTKPAALIAVCSMGSMVATSMAMPNSTVVGFDGGSDGGFQGNAFYEATGGNPDGRARHFNDSFFNELRTGAIGETTNPDFLGDYSPFNDITFSFDIKTDSLTDFIGNQIARPIGVKFIDRDIQGGSGSSGVFFEMGIQGVNFTPDWTTLSVTISDPTQVGLPAGWIGFGDEDPNTFEPILPAGATFASVLASVDEVHITGAVPGFFFGNAFSDVSIDNVTLLVPTPATASLLGLGGLLAARRRRAR
ncbi:MAG: hypothetical protein AAGK04_05090 [Planctomycetota bacterium]